MYCVNGIFPNVGFCDYSLSDGDVMRIQFTLAYGADIGGASAMGYDYADDYYKVADKDELTKLIAEKGINNVPVEALNAAIKIDSVQEDIDTAVNIIKTGKVYKDVQNHWSKDSIYFVAGRGLLKGTSESQFSPDTDITRAMLVTILHRMENKPVSGSPPFDDVPAGHWSADAVTWAVHSGIASGISETEFAPDTAITREQLAKMMYSFAAGNGYTYYSNKDDLIGFSDSKDVSEWAREALEWAVGSGIITGRTGNTLAPQGTATRGEAAAILQRYISLTSDMR